MNLLDIFLLIVLAAAVFLAVRQIRRDRRNGKSCLGCSGNCAVCGNTCARRETGAKHGSLPSGTENNADVIQPGKEGTIK